ncbi:MAG TPA: 3-oxo-tetronate kinase [Galbitalea sp.]
MAVIGVIADDFTGATDVAVAFHAGGLGTAIFFDDVDETPGPAAEVLVVGLKIRTEDPSVAVAKSLQAVRRLKSLGATRFYFKYCSTFDSRPDGNIGPVADALAHDLGAGSVVFVPGSPSHGRTQYRGHLFVDGLLLSESHMRNHPLTPMTDSNIPRVLARQTQRPVSLVPIETVWSGATEIRAARESLPDDSYTVLDALEDSDLANIAAAVVDDVLVTGGADLAGHLARLVRPGRATTPADQDLVGIVPTAGLSGSCSKRTLEQIAEAAAAGPTYRLDILASQNPAELAAGALGWYDRLPSRGSAPLIYSSLPPTDLQIVQRALGAERAAHLLETAMREIATGLVERGVRRIIVAGGETSGAVVSALGVRAGLLGEEAAPGVPWIYSRGQTPVALLLKSGNFGDSGFFRRLLAAQSTGPSW